MADAQWKKDLRPASFRGVPFEVQTSQRSGGRRGPVHEFPDRDTPFAEDKGRKARNFTITGYIHGLNYMPGRDRLISALEDVAGSGELIHPYYGRLVVQLIDHDVKESSSDGGVAQFTMTFCEAGAELAPNLSQDPSYLINQASDAAVKKQKDIFASIFSVVGMPAFVLESATSKINNFSDMVEEAAGNIPLRNDSVADLSYAIRNLRANAITLLKTPDLLAENISEALSMLRQSGDNLRDVFVVFGALLHFGSADEVIDPTTSTRAQQSENNTALNDLITVVAVAEASRIAIDIDFESIDDALQIRSTLTDSIDTQIESTLNDDTFVSLQDIRTHVADLIPPADQSLPEVTTFTPQQSINSLVLTYNLYSNPDRESDLLARNKIRHPGFIAGGSSLEVLEVE